MRLATLRRSDRPWLPLALVLLAVGTPVRVDAGETALVGEPVIPKGYEDLAAELLGRGEQIAGVCKLTGGAIDHAIHGVYQCGDNRVVIELIHPSKALPSAVRTERFAVTVQGSPPPGFLDALVARVRAREAPFQWTVLPPPPPPSVEQRPPFNPWPYAVVLTVTLLLWWARRLLGWGRRLFWWCEQRLSGWGRRLSGFGQRLLLWSRRRWPARLLASMRNFARDPMTPLRATIASEEAWAAGVLLVSTVGRFWLAWVNWQGENHLQVAQLIRAGGWRPPLPADCMQCAHPKLYHYLLAWALEIGGGNETFAARAGRLTNAAAGTVVLALLYVYSRRRQYSSPVRIAALAFVATNGMFAVAFSWDANDAFCIVFSSLGLFFLARFIDRQTLIDIGVATLFIILASLSKATGWAVFAAAAAILVIRALASEAGVRRRCIVATAILIVGFSSVVPFANPYRDNLVRSHTPFVNDAFDLPLAKFEVPRPPVAWVFQDLLTFRIFSLLGEPYMTFESTAAHRTSLWSELYGWTMFVHFPPLWGDDDGKSVPLGRICIALGILPLAAVVLGFATGVRAVGRGFGRYGRRWFAVDGDWHHLIPVVVLIAAMIAVVVRYHRTAVLFTWMNPIYLLPGLLPFYTLFLDGRELLWRRWPRPVTIGMAAMVTASATDLTLLIRHLTWR